MQKVIYFLSTIVLFSAMNIISAQTLNEYVKYNIDVDLVVTATTDTTYTLHSVEPSGDATSESAPAKVYVPVGSADKADYFLYKATNPSFRYIFDLLGNNTEFINFPMRIKTLGENRYLYAAVKDGTEYRMFARYSANELAKNNTLDYIFKISPVDICNVVFTSSTTPCSSMATGGGDTKTFTLYFYMSDSQSFTPSGLVSEHSNKYGNMYYEVSMSSRINDSANIDIVEIKKGDRRVTAFYKGTSSILNPESVRAFLRNAPSNSYDVIAGIGGAEIYNKEFPFAQESSVVINELQNDTAYLFSLGFVDKYNFVSRLSPTFDATPMAIEELLKKEACFLLTAGFGEEHYVIDYFRSFRDDILSKFYLGQVFITTYYDLAPKYALIIYEHDFARAIIRVLAYIAYFLFSNLTLIVGFLVIGFSFKFKKKFSKKNIAE